MLSVLRSVRLVGSPPCQGSVDVGRPCLQVTVQTKVSVRLGDVASYFVAGARLYLWQSVTWINGAGPEVATALWGNLRSSLVLTAHVYSECLYLY